MMNTVSNKPSLLSSKHLCAQVSEPEHLAWFKIQTFDMSQDNSVENSHKHLCFRLDAHVLTWQVFVKPAQPMKWKGLKLCLGKS